MNQKKNPIIQTKSSNTNILSLRISSLAVNWRGDQNTIKKMSKFWEDSLDEINEGRFIDDDDVWTIDCGYSNDQDDHQVQRNGQQIYYKHGWQDELLESLSLFRELITKAMLQKGAVWIHGSAFRINNRVILVLGRKGDGKTTWLLTALLKLNAEFIGNDMLWLHYCNDKVCLRRWRPDIKIHPETLELLQIPYNKQDIPDRFVWQTTTQSKGSFDPKEFFQHRQQRIKEIELPTPRLVPRDFLPIDEIVYPTAEGPSEVSQVSLKRTRLLWEQMVPDPQTVFPADLSEWNNLYTYWHKRISGLSASKEACKFSEFIIEQLIQKIPTYEVNNRIGIEKITDFLL